MTLRAAAIAMAMLCAGCATTVAPPAHVADPVTVYLTDYGRHASLLLPAAAPNLYTEYAFGDWEFFCEGNTAWWVGARALLSSPQATLGRRHVKILSADDARLRGALECERIMRFDVSAARARALALTLDGPFRRSDQAPVWSDYSKLYHIKDDEHYWLLNNCNQVTARWLRRLGCDVRGPAIFSNFRLDSRGRSRRTSASPPPARHR